MPKQLIELAPAKGTQLTAEGNAENKKAGNSFSRTEYEFIRTSILPWVISNPGKTPKKGRHISTEVYGYPI